MRGVEEDGQFIYLVYHVLNLLLKNSKTKIIGGVLIK